MTAALGPYIMRHSEVKNNMEYFILQFVSPDSGAIQSGTIFESYHRKLVCSCFSSLFFLLLSLGNLLLTFDLYQ